MRGEYNRKKSCKNKFPFSTEAAAKAVAKKYGQTSYCCPVCFCWHNTSLKTWEDEYVHIDKYKALEERFEKLTKNQPNLSEIKSAIRAKYVRVIFKQMEKLAEYRNKIKELNKIIHEKN